MIIGQTIDHYYILERLGEGGMAEVYKAMDLNLDREVAVKFLRTDPRNFEKSRKRFELEAKALAMLDHPNIVRVLDFGEFKRHPYLVMEYIPGGTLKQRLGKPMLWNEACSLLIPIAEALQYAHERKIIHRDIKPSNILIKADGTPMLSDFGVAKILELDETLDLTGTSIGVGTPYYMAPEQGKSKHIDHRVDVYALGLVLYELITGRKPYDADTPFAVLLKHIQDPLPRPRDFIKDLPGNVERVILRALAKDPEQRINNMGEFIDLINLAINRENKGNIFTKRTTILIGGLVIISSLLIGFAIWFNGIDRIIRQGETQFGLDDASTLIALATVDSKETENNS